MRIRIADAGRHRRLSGYGMLARQIILGLADRGHEVAVQAVKLKWDDVEPGAAERIGALPAWSEDESSGADLVLQVGTPQAARAFKLPTLIYTQHALSRLPASWAQALQAVCDGVIVPGAYDRRVFTREVERVWIANQSSSPEIFKPRPDWRAEGPEEFTFMFVGSYSWRKGVDVLLRAFLEEFDPSEPVRLSLYCPGAAYNAFNHLLELLQGIEPRGKVRFSPAGHLSPPWMSRHYNRADALITLSRGEGWCMPASEALLCEKPVIAPASTGFLEYLDASVARLVPTRDVVIADVEDEFGGSMVAAYGEPGVVGHEPELDAAKEAMREVFEDPRRWQEAARRGAKRIRKEVTWDACAQKIEAACIEFLGEVRQGRQ